MEVIGNRLYDRDPLTNALVPVVLSGTPDGCEIDIKGNRLYVREPSTNALIPVVSGFSGGSTPNVQNSNRPVVLMSTNIPPYSVGSSWRRLIYTPPVDGSLPTVANLSWSTDAGPDYYYVPEQGELLGFDYYHSRSLICVVSGHIDNAGNFYIKNFSVFNGFEGISTPPAEWKIIVFYSSADHGMYNNSLFFLDTYQNVISDAVRVDSLSSKLTILNGTNTQNRRYNGFITI